MAAFQLTFGFLPLTDAAPLIVAQAKGWFQQHGITATLQRSTSWTAVRDALSRGDLQAAHLLYSMPLAGACGLLGGKHQPLVIPWVLSRNGQGITLNQTYRGRVAGDAKALLAAAREGRDAGRPLVFAHTLRVGTHALWLRYWLAAGGIHPNDDVALITVPPPQMADNMRSARLDGLCVGEPWNVRLLHEGLGFTATTSASIWPDHPEKVCAFTAAFTQQHPEAVVATLKALHQASVWLDQPAHHTEAAELLARPEFLNCTPAWIAARLGAALDLGDGRTAPTAHPVTFAARGANRPLAAEASWFLTQLRRWGLHYGTPDYAGITASVLRPDLHDRALGELGLPVPPVPSGFTLGDGTSFDPAQPEAYARSFALHTLQG